MVQDSSRTGRDRHSHDRDLFVLMDRVGSGRDRETSSGVHGAGPRLAVVAWRSPPGDHHPFAQQSQRTHDAMRLRSYRGTMPFGPLPAMGRRRRPYRILRLIGIASARLLEWGMKG